MARNCKFPIKCATTHTATVSRACFGKYFGDRGKELPPTTTRVLWLLLLLLFVVCAVCRVLGVVLWEYGSDNERFKTVCQLSRSRFNETDDDDDDDDDYDDNVYHSG